MIKRLPQMKYQTYNKNKQSGKGAGSSVPVTMEMEKLKGLEKLAVNEYKKEAKVRRVAKAIIKTVLTLDTTFKIISL